MKWWDAWVFLVGGRVCGELHTSSLKIPEVPAKFISEIGDRFLVLSHCHINCDSGQY